MTSARPGVRRKTIGQIFGIPLLTALLSAIGLVSALVGDGIWDSVSWVMLLFPILLCVYCLRQAQKRVRLLIDRIAEAFSELGA